jgi:predicted metal-dependent peptidase
MPRRSAAAPNPAAEAIDAGWRTIASHPLFRPLTSYTGLSRVRDDPTCPPDGHAVLDSDGSIHPHRSRRADADVWAWTFAHLLCHLGFDHLPVAGNPLPDGYLQAAQCTAVDRFLSSLKIGTPPEPLPAELPSSAETVLAATWRERGAVPSGSASPGVGGAAGCLAATRTLAYQRHVDYQTLLARGLSDAATAAVDVAGGRRASLSDAAQPKKAWELALSWFVSSYPLLGALASGLRLVADADLCRAWDIRIAAVSAADGEIYINPLAQHASDEWKFILAHEMLHAALRHDSRAAGRDPHLYNVAADLMINGWLVEMSVGQMPDGLLYDPQLRGMSSEEIYDRIVGDLRRARKLMTLRGVHAHGGKAGEFGGGDILSRRLPGQPAADFVDLDAFYRSSLTTGLAYHEQGERGLLPAGLVEQIRALEHPPLPWDAQLARWFDEHVPSVEPERSYARPSRRQASTPDIPRAGWVWPEELVARSTFGVVLDTSGSMDVRLLGKALGAIASFAAARDVPAARLVCCDAAAYDMGYLAPEAFAERISLRGRGGTVLQPGIDLLLRAEDFPPTAPVLIITDAECDVVRVKREHAYLIPAGRRLPFTTTAPVFSFE